jgi:O-antigen chain-terminating methyltransferase
MATKRKPRKSSVAGDVVREIHAKVKKQDDASGDPGPMVRRFEMALQMRFRGPEEDVKRKLAVHLAQIQHFNPPALPWIDLGCGRGEWLDIASAAGADVTGVDRNEFAIEQCVNRNLPVIQRDALDHLRGLADDSTAVLTAFHFFENCEFSYILALMRESARVLAPGGVFVLETPNPENQRVASYQFWLDPTHLRPLPQELMEFTFEHFGLRVAHLEGLNPNDQHVPQDYTVVAVR